jgi:hypothetical protein
MAADPLPRGDSGARAFWDSGCHANKPNYRVTVPGIITSGREWTAYLFLAMLAFAVLVWFWTWWGYRDRD